MEESPKVFSEQVVNMDVEQVLREGLPPPWNYGVTSDGRIFFIKYVYICFCMF